MSDARRSGAIAVVTNPRSRHNRNNPSLGPSLAYVLGERGEIVSPTDLPSLAATAERFRDRGVDVVCVSGGDGTIHQVLTAVLRAYADREPPTLAVLRGGTMNIVADSVGARLSPEAMLGRVVDAHHGRSELPTTTRRVLRVELDGGPAYYGFLSGNGIIARFLELYYEKPEPTPADAGLLLLRGAASAMVGGRLVRRLTRKFRGQVLVDGAELGGDEWIAVALGTIEEMGLGFRVFPQMTGERLDRFEFVALGGTVADVARELPRLYRGFGVSRPTSRAGLAETLELVSAEPIQLMIDGDFYVAPGGRVRYSLGPEIRFLVPG